MTETDLAHGTSPTRINGVTSSLRAAGRDDIYDLQKSPARGKKRRREEDIQEEVDVQEEGLPQMNGSHDDAPMQFEDDPVQGIDEGGFPDEIEANMPDADVALVETPSSQKRHRRPQKAHVPTPSQAQEITPLRGSGAARGKETKRGVVSGSGSAALRRDYTPEVAEEEDFANGTPAQHSSPAARKGRKPKSLWAPPPSELEPDSAEDSAEDVYIEEAGHENIDPTLLEPDEYPRPSSKKKAASKVKTKALNIHHDLAHNDNTVQSIETVAPPAKRARGRPKKFEQKKSAPKERNPNVPHKVANSQKVVDRATTLNRLSKGELDELLAPGRTQGTRSNVLLREETPLETDGVYKTRSGRTSVPKLDTWAGEQIHYARDGTVQGVVRATSVEPVARRPGAGRPRSGANSKARGQKGMKAIQEEEEALEEWEMEDGILGGWVNEWDDALNNNTGKAIEEGRSPSNFVIDLPLIPHADLAYASQGIQTREVAGANFKYCKIFAKPWFGIGMVDIPVDGMKKAKNSRRMQMAFFVIKGKVGVTVADNEFVISQGGIWQVPRGKCNVFCPKFAFLHWHCHTTILCEVPLGGTDSVSATYWNTGNSDSIKMAQNSSFCFTAREAEN